MDSGSQGIGAVVSDRVFPVVGSGVLDVFRDAEVAWQLRSFGWRRIASR